MGGPTHLQVHDVILWYHDIIQAIFEQKSPLDTSYRKSQMLAIKWKAKWPLVWDVPQLVSTWKSNVRSLRNMKNILNRYVGGSSHAAPPHWEKSRKFQFFRKLVNLNPCYDFRSGLYTLTVCLKSWYHNYVRFFMWHAYPLSTRPYEKNSLL